jgi:hypothetical protein
VAQRSVPPADLVVLDATTLAVMRTVSAHGSDLYPPGFYPTGATGSQVLVRHSGSSVCTQWYLWLDAASGAVADSASPACGHSYLGARPPPNLQIITQYK